jgi:hypothetical protein
MERETERERRGGVSEHQLYDLNGLKQKFRSECRNHYPLIIIQPNPIATVSLSGCITNQR